MVKYSLYLFTALAACWGAEVTSGRLLLKFYTVGVPVGLWMYVYMTGYDVIATWRGQNSDYIYRFYSGLRADFYQAIIGGVTLFLIFYLASVRYSWSNIDIASAAIPLFISGGFAIRRLMSMRVAGVKLRRRAFVVPVLFLLISYIYSVNVMANIVSGTYTSSESIWLQISILCAGLYSFVESRRVEYFLKHGQIELSRPIQQFFRSTKYSSGLYEQAGADAEAWNKHVSELKRENSAKRKKKRKKRNKKKK